MQRHAIGVDIGGTYTKLALADEGGNVKERDSFNTPQHPSPEPVVAAIVAKVMAFRDRVAAAGFIIEGIGFAIPHFHEGPDWIQRQTNNMPSLEGFPMYAPLRQAFGPSIIMINDVSAAGVSEHRYGKGRNADRLLFVAIGTGIGTSLVVKHEGLVTFFYDTSGDTGQVIVDPLGQSDCTCGGRGCLEAVASGHAIRRIALAEIERGRTTLLSKVKAEKGDLEARDVAEAAEAGDSIAKDIFEEAGFYLGVGLTSYLHIFCPSLIVLGGGVAESGQLLVEPARRTMKRLASPWHLSRLSGIEVSTLGEEAQAVGCASLVLDPGEHA